MGSAAELLPATLKKLFEPSGVVPPHVKLITDGTLTPDHLRYYASIFREIGLSVSAQLAEEMAVACNSKGIVKRDQNDTIPELARQIRRELSAVYLMAVPNDKVGLLKEADPFGSAVPDRFPEVADEITEASRSLAFGLNTASVFHLMRIVEAGLTALVTSLGISDYLPSWKGLLSQVDKALADLEKQKKDASARAKIRVISEARLHIAAIKDAWRNPTIHKIAKSYDDRQARRVYETVRDFIEQLARELPR
jgi:hypothetical protein